MYRILIVDDEKIERNGIKFLLNRMKFEVEIAEAENGKTAIEYLKNNKTDILLTDIKMPFMNGIELIQRIADDCIDMKIIIFSGYNDFEYARQAIKYGAMDYILKPVNPVEFETTIKKSIEELNQLNNEKQREGESLSFMREHLLYSLVNGQTKNELIRKTHGLLDINFIDLYHRMFLIEFKQDFFDKAGIEFEKTCKEYLKLDFQYLNLNPEQGLMLFKSNVFEEWENIGYNLYRFIHTTYGTECHIAISEEFSDGDMIPRCFSEMEFLMEQKFFQTNNHVYLNFKEETPQNFVEGDADTLSKQMIQDIKLKNISSLREHFAQFCNKYQEQIVFSQVYIKFRFSNLLKICYENLPDMDEKKLNQEIDALFKANNLDSVMDIVACNIERLEKEFCKNKENYRREVEIIKQYIYHHYNQELGVEQLANQIYMTPSYLSTIFKKETGQNLSKFIKSYRMEKAKEMLENTNERILSICTSIGYANVSYFCQSFREYFGISPQKYRDKGELYEISD